VARGTSKEVILVVDDAPDTLEILQRNLASQGYGVLTASGAAEAIGIIKRASPDLVITDLKMPSVSGLDLVRYVRQNCQNTEVMMITGYATIEGAVEAVKSGAEAYLPKPFSDEELLAAVGHALDKLRAHRAMRQEPEGGTQEKYGLLGESQCMRDVWRAIGRAAQTSDTVLISGESGTGKEMVARAIHYSGWRAAAPFVPVNCAGIPEGLLESELFGHVRGAFTGAIESRAGFFQAAEGGTVFLDEVGDTSPSMQAKLLRVLENKEVCMVGSTRPRAVDVRILAATNRPLPELVNKSLFREDLYYRLHVIGIELPPLRDRGNDILLLTRHFAMKHSEELGRKAPDFSDAVLEALRDYHWPGNVRELANVVRRLLVMNEAERIDVADLPSLMRASSPPPAEFGRPLREVEAEYIRNVLASVGGNRTHAARVLGIDRKTLRKKIKNQP
jgi:two-component system response regulator HydG